MGQTYFTRDSFKFLSELKSHNTKAWFEGNKERYETGLRQPALQLVSDLAPTLAAISTHFVVDPRPNGGSLSRIHRDTRFSKDKSPYKTGLFFHFHHRDGRNEASPGFYLHVAPGGSRVGGGVWRPQSTALQAIRLAIATQPDAWTKTKPKTASTGPGYMMIGDSLKAVPRGFDREHVYAEDLKRKDFGMSWSMTDATLLGGDLVGELGNKFKAVAPFVVFICKAVGLGW